MIPPKRIIGGNTQARHHEHHRRYTEAHHIVDSEDIVTRDGPRGTALVFKRQPGGAQAPEEGVRVARFRIVGVPASGQYVTANKYNDDGTLGTDLYSIARPQHLRAASQTRTRSVLGGTITESIQPAYAAGGDIVAILDPEGGTGLIISGNIIHWLDLNNAGRNWFPDYRAVCVRVDDVDRQMIVPGGPPF